MVALAAKGKGWSCPNHVVLGIWDKPPSSARPSTPPPVVARVQVAIPGTASRGRGVQVLVSMSGEGWEGIWRFPRSPCPILEGHYVWFLLVLHLRKPIISGLEESQMNNNDNKKNFHFLRNCMISITSYYNSVNSKLGLSNLQMRKLKPGKGKSVPRGLKKFSERAGSEPMSVWNYSPQFYFVFRVNVDLPLYFYMLWRRLREGEEFAYGHMMSPWLSWDLNFCLLSFCLGHSEVTDFELVLEKVHFFMCKMRGGVPCVAGPWENSVGWHMQNSGTSTHEISVDWWWPYHSRAEGSLEGEQLALCLGLESSKHLSLLASSSLWRKKLDIGYVLEEPEPSVFKACDSELRQSRTSFSIDSKVRLIWDNTMV